MDLLDSWKSTVPQKCEELLKLPLFFRSKCHELELNFHPEASEIILLCSITYKIQTVQNMFS